MRERPILFSGPMVRAILEGRKTQTRRVMTPQPDDSTPGYWAWSPRKGVSSGKVGAYVWGPYGVSGDRLWVRETYRLRADQDHKKPIEDWWKSGASWYEADGPCTPSGCGGGAGKLRPSIHMPRWASRLTLEVTGVRVEQLNKISEDDAKAEGVDPYEWPGGPANPHAVGAFRELWDRINGKRHPWSSNPWVWVVEFKRIEVPNV